MGVRIVLCNDFQFIDNVQTQIEEYLTLILFVLSCYRLPANPVGDILSQLNWLTDGE